MCPVELLTFKKTRASSVRFGLGGNLLKLAQLWLAWKPYGAPLALQPEGEIESYFQLGRRSE